MSYIKELRFSHFRNYEDASMDDVGASFVVLSGSNGAGKTNILEAVSLLTPGRGLRNTKLSEIQRQTSENPWTIFSKVETEFG